MSPIARPGDYSSAMSLVYGTLADGLRAQIGRRQRTVGDLLARLLILLKRWLSRAANRPVVTPLADGMLLVSRGWHVRGANGYTLGNYLFVRDGAADRLFVIHEYTHVLQWRAEGVRFLWHYIQAGLWNWPDRDADGWPDNVEKRNAYETQAIAIEACYRLFPELPDPWLLK